MTQLYKITRGGRVIAEQLTKQEAEGQIEILKGPHPYGVRQTKTEGKKNYIRSKDFDQKWGAWQLLEIEKES